MSGFCGHATTLGLIFFAQQSATGPWAAAGLVLLGVLAAAWMVRQLWLSFRQADQFVTRPEFEAALSLLRGELDTKLSHIDGRLAGLDTYLHEAHHRMAGAMGLVATKVETLVELEKQRRESK